MITPLGRRVLLKRDDVTDKSESGALYIPSNAQKRPKTAVVKALGDGMEDGKHRPFEVAIGDRVVIEEHAGGTVISAPDGDYFLIKEVDILAKSLS